MENQAGLSDQKIKELDAGDKFRPAEDRLANIDGDIQGLNKTMAVFEQKHTETAEKIKKVTVVPVPSPWSITLPIMLLLTTLLCTPLSTTSTMPQARLQGC